ncbi:MAG: alpha/beta hydrolase [Deltaproteobacteria bacterium]|nr:alpha/beta hydrolase [Deltaproteobacteria bacterium]
MKGDSIEPARMYGKPPCTAAVLHGGPGACGEVAPVARELGRRRGVLEPMQQAVSVEGEIRELEGLLEAHARPPVTLVGFSWGAWLAWLFAARFPSRVHKLILVAAGPFEDAYAAGISDVRFSRLRPEEQTEAGRLMDVMDHPGAGEADAAFARLGKLLERADAFDPVPGAAEPIRPRLELFQRVWPEAAEMRKSGALLELGAQIACPVVAIHGDHDPHPAEGVRKPLSLVLDDFQFILLERCGHRPWIERHARDAFFRALESSVP